MNLLYLNSDVLGTGDKELGEKLLISFLKQTLSSSLKIDTIFCVNSAAKLTTINKKAIELFKQFQEQGTIISTCGSCLEYYKLKDKLAIGDIGSMNLLVQLMANAKKIIQA
jgi:selenium metabolism protein YedF